MSNLPAVEKEALLPEVSSNENELAVQHQSQSLVDLPDIDYDQPEFTVKNEQHMQASTTALSLMEKGKEAKVCWCHF